MNILIIGLGSIGQRHLRNINKLKFKKKIFILRKKFFTPTLSSKLQIIKTRIEKKYKINFIKKLEEVKKLKIDLALICTPTAFHISQAVYLINNNINTFVEKPLGSNLKDLNNLRKAILKNKNVKTMVGYQLKFNPMIKKIKLLLQKRLVGKICSIEVKNGEHIKNFHPYEDYKNSYAAIKKLGGGVVLTQSHELDLLMFLFSDHKISKIKSINSKMTNLKINVEDTSMSILEFKKNNKNIFICSLILNYYEIPKSKNITIIGENGKIKADFIKKTIILNYEKNSKKYKFKFNKDKVFETEINYFINCIRNKKKINQLFTINQSINVLKNSIKILRN